MENLISLTGWAIAGYCWYITLSSAYEESIKWWIGCFILPVAWIYAYLYIPKRWIFLPVWWIGTSLFIFGEMM